MRFRTVIWCLLGLAMLTSGCRARSIRNFPGTNNTADNPRKYKAELQREYRQEMKRMKQVPRSEKKVQEWAFDAHSQNDDTQAKAKWWAWHFWNEQIGTKEDRKKRRELKKQEKVAKKHKKKSEHRKRK